MRVLIPGHVYELANLDTHEPGDHVEILRFVKRIGPRFPGNQPPATSGTITQEVIRALIDRQHYVNSQRPDPTNAAVLRHLREALIWLEVRAADERGDGDASLRIRNLLEPETEPTCETCGHVLCRREHGVSQ